MVSSSNSTKEIPDVQNEVAEVEEETLLAEGLDEDGQ